MDAPLHRRVRLPIHLYATGIRSCSSVVISSNLPVSGDVFINAQVEPASVALSKYRDVGVGMLTDSNTHIIEYTPTLSARGRAFTSDDKFQQP